MSLHPVAVFVLRAAFVVLLVMGVAQKLRAPAAFAEAIDGYQLLPPSAVRPAAILLIVAELALAAGLAVGSAAAIAGTAGLLALYSSAIGVNLVRGRRDIDCGCGGLGAHRTLSGWLIVRNGALIGCLSLLLLPSAERMLTWIDAVTTLGGVVTLLVLYAALDLLAVNAPKLETLRRG